MFYEYKPFLSETGRIRRRPMENSLEKLTTMLPVILTRIVDANIEPVQEHIEMLRVKNPGLNAHGLAGKIVSRASLKSGMVGAATGLGGAITLPDTVPTDLLCTWKIQVRMALTVAVDYGVQKSSEEFAEDILLIMAGNAASQALKRAGMAAAEELTQKIVDKYVTRAVMKKINKILSRKIITKAGEKSFTSFTKLVPLIGAPIGFGTDWAPQN